MSANECQRIFYQIVGVSGEVTITPKIACGPITVTCLESQLVRGQTTKGKDWHKGDDGTCRLTVFQELCVAVPITFGAKAQCALTDIYCGPASADPEACFCADSSSSDSSSGSSSDSTSDGSSGSTSDGSSDSSSGSCSDSTSGGTASDCSGTSGLSVWDTAED